jgi:hypothetical protein
VSRRAWARNSNAIDTVASWNQSNAERGHVTEPYLADSGYLERLVDQS